MPAFAPDLMDAIRARFAHVDQCPFQGPRIFFENAGGALTLKSVVETSAIYAAIPDNQGRDNPAAHALVKVIEDAKADAALFFNAPGGQVFVGESGTELTFRLIRAAILGTVAEGGVVLGSTLEEGVVLGSTLEEGVVLGSTLEHPASRSACARWAGVAGVKHVLVPHDPATGTVNAADYRAHLSPDVRVATIIHTSPVTGMGVDIAAIAAEIRAVAPDALIIVDGIQHASHGGIDIAGAGVDGYVISPYKVFSRHGYGIAWVSDRLAGVPHDMLDGAPATGWEMGTRDTGAYATFRDVVAYFRWLGAEVSDATEPRAQIEAAGAAIHAHEAALTEAMLHGIDNLRGLADMPGVQIIGGVENPAREGLVSLNVAGIPAADVVAALNAQGIRTHVRKADHYSANVLEPLGLEACVRVSLCHYNSLGEVSAFLSAMAGIVGD